jgi:REP element-mobilizing transposase RayT
MVAGEVIQAFLPVLLLRGGYLNCLEEREKILGLVKEQAGMPVSREMDSSVNRSMRNLPHWHREGSTAIYWITFRLADSLPQEELAKLKLEKSRFMNEYPKPWRDEVRLSYQERFPAKIENWLDAGYGSCVLAAPGLRQHLVDAVLKFDGERHDLISGVIMPNHVHLLLRLRAGNELSQLLKGIKGTSAKWINKATGMTGTPLWMDESYDHIVRSKEELVALQRYIRDNPVRLKEGSFWLEEREVSFQLVSDPLLKMLFAVDE